MCIRDRWHALLDDEDEWEKNGGWFGAMLGAPVAMIGGVPMLGAAVEFGYKQAKMCIRDRPWIGCWRRPISAASANWNEQTGTK